MYFTLNKTNSTWPERIQTISKSDEEQISSEMFEEGGREWLCRASKAGNLKELCGQEAVVELDSRPDSSLDRSLGLGMWGLAL